MRGSQGHAASGHSWAPLSCFALLPSTLLACSGGATVAPPVPLEVASEKVTFGTIQDLGGFVFQSSTRDERTANGQTTVVETAVSLKWRDRDLWEYQAVRGGKPTTHWLVANGAAWVGLSGAPLASRGDPEPFRQQLALGWDPWEDVVAATGGRIAFGPGTEEVVEGRPALRHDVSLEAAPPAATAPRVIRGQALVPTGLSGTVWIDRQSAVRVLADVTATAGAPTAAGSTAPPRTRSLNVKLAVTGLGQDPGVAVSPGVSPPLSPGSP